MMKPNESPASGLIDRRAVGVVVANPMLPQNWDVAVVVASKFPTVSWVPVAMSVVPSESETIIEFGEKDVAFVPP